MDNKPIQLIGSSRKTRGPLRAFKGTFFLVLFVLFGSVGLAGPDKTFEDYKNEIITFGKAREFDRAMALLEESKRRFPKEKEFQAGIYYHSAYGFYQSGQFDKVRSLLSKASQDYPFNDALWALYARLLIKTGDSKKGLDILGRYPNNPDSFTEDLRKKRLNIWTTYNLAACYSLLEKYDLALMYLSTLFSAQGFDPKISFSHVEEDPDFNALRDDPRYVFLANLAFAENFNDALRMLERSLKDAWKRVERFYLYELPVSEAARALEKSIEGINRVNTPAPLLIRIRRQIVRCIEETRQQILVSQSSIAGTSHPQIVDGFKTCESKVIRQLRSVRRSQNRR